MIRFDYFCIIYLCVANFAGDFAVNGDSHGMAIDSTDADESFRASMKQARDKLLKFIEKGMYEQRWPLPFIPAKMK